MRYIAVKRDKKYVYVKMFENRDDALRYAGEDGKIITIRDEAQGEKEVGIKQRSSSEPHTDPDTIRDLLMLNIRQQWRLIIRISEQENTQEHAQTGRQTRLDEYL